LWKKLVGSVSASGKQVLYNVMLSAKVTFDGREAWTLFCQNKFEEGMLEKSRADLEGLLTAASGRRIKLSFTAGGVPSRASAAPSASGPAAVTPSAEEEPPQEDWSGAEQGDQRPPGEEPELKHLNKVFHGRIRRVQKIDRKEAAKPKAV
jgi:hypothetical protein